MKSMTVIAIPMITPRMKAPILPGPPWTFRVYENALPDRTSVPGPDPKLAPRCASNDPGLESSFFASIQLSLFRYDRGIHTSSHPDRPRDGRQQPHLPGAAYRRRMAS